VGVCGVFTVTRAQVATLLAVLAGSLTASVKVILAMVFVAVVCCSAVCLPISTAPDAIACSRRQLSARDFLMPNLIGGVIVPLVVLRPEWAS